jgi:hypothetical protein
MATIYRFIVEARQAGGVATDADGVVIPRKGAGSKGGSSGSGSGFNFGGSRGGVEHNRYMRPINPLMNRLTGGYWEKGQRVGRAMLGLPEAFKTKDGKFTASGFGSTASLILIQFAIMEADKLIREQMKKAKEENQANYLKIVSGQTTLGQDYKVSRNIFGKITYRNQ